MEPSTSRSPPSRSPFPFDTPLSDYRQDLIEWGQDREYFHASEDNARVRQRVFQTICACLALLRADAIVVEKCKTAPSLRVDERFYPRMLGYLLGYVFRGVDVTHISQVIVITDRIPVKGKRRAIEKGIKEHLASVLPDKVPYHVLHHESKSWYGLQVADYMNWAIFRKWERGDSTAANLVQPCINSEFDIFRFGQKRCY